MMAFLGWEEKCTLTYRNTEACHLGLLNELTIYGLFKSFIMCPTVFISYSHDSEEHKKWVLQLATRLRSNGVDAILDAWNKLGIDLSAFMEQGLSKSRRVICICSEQYVEKANAGIGGVGYEKGIICAKYLKDQNSHWVIPLIRNNISDKKVPTFLESRLYIDFCNSNLYEAKYEELLRDILDEPILPIPPLGENPFKNIKEFAKQKFIPANEKYVSPASQGQVTFDYSNNNGRYCIGQGALMFELFFSKASNEGIYVLNDPESIDNIALVKDCSEIEQIVDARIYDNSSRCRLPFVGQIVVLQNVNGFYAAIKILAIKDDTRGDLSDEVTFQYVIQTNGSPAFSKL